MVLPDDFFKCIADGIQKILIGVDNSAVQIKLDYCLHSVNCVYACLSVCIVLGTLGDIGGKFNDFVRVTCVVKNGVVRCIDPDFVALFCEAFVLTGMYLPTSECLPEICVLRRFCKLVFAEHTMMLANDFVEVIADYRQEIVICMQYVAV